MFDNEHLTYICGHYKKGASETYDSRQHSPGKKQNRNTHNY